MNPRFIQISTLTSYPAALLNRDDSGLAKRMEFGGVIRTRVSSQCLKRHWRTAEDAYSLSKVQAGLDLSVRSRIMFRTLLLEPMIEEGYDEAMATAVLKAFQASLYEGKEAKDSAGLDRKEVVVLGWPEIRFLLQEARAICDKAEGDASKAAKEAKDHLKQKAVKASFQALTYGAGIDAAMYGRFVSGDAEARISSAVHVAHALTVHQESSETDYFSAIDDLLVGKESGSGHLGAAELTSGLYYTYLVVDAPQLVSNLQGVDRARWLEADREVAARAIRHLVHLVATVSPGAKLGSTAPYDHAGLVLAELGERQPRTLANAFLNPVELGPGLFDRSLDALAEYVGQLDGMYGASEKRWLACRLPEFQVPNAERLDVDSLALQIERAVLAGEV